MKAWLPFALLPFAGTAAEDWLSRAHIATARGRMHFTRLGAGRRRGESESRDVGLHSAHTHRQCRR